MPTETLDNFKTQSLKMKSSILFPQFSVLISDHFTLAHYFLA